MGALCTSVATGKEASRHPGRDYRNQPLKGHLVSISLLLMHILDVEITGMKNISQVFFSGCSDKTLRRATAKDFFSKENSFDI